jgi:uncharacterized protein YbjT (DUF2867 family)
MVDPRDVGTVAAAVLTADGHDGRTYTLTGPEAISYSEVAETLSAVTGRQVEFLDVPEEAAEAGLSQAGMPEWLVRQIVGVFRLIRGGRLAEVTDTVCVLTGQEPRRFTDFAHEVAPLLRPGSGAPMSSLGL